VKQKGVAAGRAGQDREAHIIKDAKRKFGDCAYLGRSGARRGFTTGSGVIHCDPAAEVSSGSSTYESEEGPNRKRES